MAIRVAARPNAKPHGRDVQRTRYWLTAKAARALGHEAPDHIPDGDAVALVTKES